MSVKITFLMIAYNAEKYVRQSVESVLSQTEPDINLLVRNNGSTDGTGDILREIAAKDSRVTVFTNKRNWRGDTEGDFRKDGVVRIWPLIPISNKTYTSQATNPHGSRGFVASNLLEIGLGDRSLLGEYISIIDSDDLLVPDFAKTLYEAGRAVTADIVSSGHTSVTADLEFIDRTLPPPIVTRDLRKEHDAVRKGFPRLYNAFRTWWGKLFRTDFFLEHYDYAWRTTGGLYGTEFDTVHMLSYLAKARAFVSLDRETYLFRVHGGGSYNARPPSYERALQAEAILRAGREVMRACSAGSAENEAFLGLCMLGFWTQSAQGIAAGRGNGSLREELSWLAVMYGSEAITAHYAANGKLALTNALILTEDVYKKGGGLSLYTSFFMRLRYVVSELGRNPGNLLLYPILLGCLYDRENKNDIGREFLSRVAVSPEFEGLAGKINARSKWEAGLNTERPDILWPNPFSYEGVETVTELEDGLETSMEAGEFEETAALLDKLLVTNPLSLRAMLCRIKLCAALEEWEPAAVLAGTAIALWPSDMDAQRLSWELFAGLPKG